MNGFFQGYLLEMFFGVTNWHQLIKNIIKKFYFNHIIYMYSQKQPALHRRWSFPFIVSSLNVIKSAVSLGFGHICWRNL